MLLAAVGHTAVHVADWGDVVLVVDGAVVEVDDEVDVLLLHPTAATESAASVAAAANRRFIMISSCHQVHGLGRAKGPEHRYGYPRGAITWVIRRTWAEAMEPQSAASVDLPEEAVE